MSPFNFGGYLLPWRPSQDLSSIAIAYQWVGRIFTICVEMILPGIAGYWLDQYFGFEFSFLALVGFLLGLVFGMTHLVLMANALSSGKPQGLSRLSSGEPDEARLPESTTTGSLPCTQPDDPPRHD